MTSQTAPAHITARSAGFVHDVWSIAIRAIRQLPRDLETTGPALAIPLFFLVINIGSLQDIAGFTAIEIDYKAFQLPVAIVFAVTGVSRAPALVLDIQNGYFDRLMLTPVSRRALLLGHMVADFVLVVALVIPVVILGFIIVNSSFLLFFPFAFVTSSFVPLEDMTGWLGTAAQYNPVTYLLEGLRSLFIEWDAVALGKGFLAIAGLALVSQTLAFLALKGRVARG